MRARGSRAATAHPGSLQNSDEGPKLHDALIGIGRWTVRNVKRSDTAAGFEAIPRGWAVERIFAWLGKCRRLAKDWEKSAEAWLLIAQIRYVTRRFARA